MKRLLIVAGTLGALSLAGLTGGVALAGTVADTMEQQCLATLNLPPAGCACIGGKAETELSPKQQEFVVAMLTQDQAASARLRGEMTVIELTQAASWMGRAPKECARQ